MLKYIQTYIRVTVALGCLLGLTQMINADTYPPKGWKTDVFEAVEEAKASDKRIFMKFTGSDWCGYCQQLDSKILKKKAFQDYARDNLVLVYLDFPASIELSEWQVTHNEYMKNVFQVEGYPRVILLEPDLQLSLVTGYQDLSPEEYVKHLKEDDLSEAISAEENKEIAAELGNIFGVVKQELESLNKS